MDYDPTGDQASPPQNESPPPPSDEESPPSPPKSPPSTPPEESPPPPDNSPPPPVLPPPADSPPDPVTPPAPIFSPPDAPVAPGLKPPPPPRSRPSPNRSSPSKDSGSSSSPNVAIIAGAAAAGIVIILLLCICVCCCRKKKKKPQTQMYYMDPHQRPYHGEMQYYDGGSSKWNGGQSMDHVVKFQQQQQPLSAMMSGASGWGQPQPPPPQQMNSTPSTQMGGFNQSQFSYEMLATATNGFSKENMLGQGGFGYVYKGVLPSGKVVAIKSLKAGSGQGEREFQAEVEIISRVHHRHLVSLVGYCISERLRMLVYEYVPNKTLEFHLHGKGQPVMDWGTRLKIALGSAKGLAYLHEDCHPKIIHRDIKAANILLDENFEAMVADFGLAKLNNDNNTHVSTRVMGTFGYLAPEYASSGKLTEKSDVFSFGVMLLELITGHPPVDPTGEFMEDSLVDWARPLMDRAIQEGMYLELVDKRLEGNFDPQEMARMVSCASSSVRHSARRRPRMSQIVRALEGNSSLDDLNDVGKTMQSNTSSTSGSGSSGNTNIYDTRAYNADIMKFRQMVLSEDSSEFGTTGEFSVNADTQERH